MKTLKHNIVATQPLKLRFFDLEALIRSDSCTYIDLFTQMYRRFQIETLSTLPRPPLECQVLTTARNPWGKSVLLLDREVYPLHDPRLLEGYVYERILSAIVARVRSHFLIHAGVVAYQGHGIILAADSFHGKTTLVLELVRRGFTFLSDEMAALSRSDRRVHSFPRSLRIRPGTLELAGFPEVANGAPEWLGKLLLDIESIRPDSLGESAAIKHIVILRDPAETTWQPLDYADQEVGILVDRVDRAFLAAVRRIAGVIAVRVDTDRGYPLLKVCAAHRTVVLSQIEVMCQERQIAVLGVKKRVDRRPDFKSPAQLKPIPRSQAVMELLQRFLGGHKSALLQDDFAGSSARLFVELAAIVGQAKCYQLNVGPLHDMADLVSDLVSTT